MNVFRLFKRRRTGQLETKGSGAKKKGPATPKPATPKQVIARSIVPVTVVLMLWGICAVCLLYQPTRGSSFVDGERVDEMIFAKIDFQYTDSEETESRRREARRKVRDIYQIGTAENRLTKTNLNHLYAYIDQSTAGEGVPHIDGVSLKEMNPVFGRMTAEEIVALKLLLSGDDKQRAFTASIYERIAEPIVAAIDQEEFSRNFLSVNQIEVLDERGERHLVDAASLRTPQIAAEEVVDAMNSEWTSLNERMEKHAVGVVAQLIAANMVYLPNETLHARNTAASGVSVVRKWIKRGTAFIKRGQIITQDDLLKKSAHDNAVMANTRGQDDLLRDASTLIITMIIILLGCMLVYNLRPNIRNSEVVLIGAVIALTMLIVRGTEIILLSLWGEGGTTVYVMPGLPLALSAVLLSILLDQKIGVVAAIFQGLLVAVQNVEPMQIPQVLMLSMTAGSLGAYAVRKARTRIKTFRAGLVVAAAVFVVCACYLVVKMAPIEHYFTILMIAAINGFLTLLLANLVLPVCETTFGITSKVTLFELSDLNHSLLKRLQLEAPGTYHHSQMVATLSEHAAEAINANALLCRVSSYFHDIGKLSNPLYFTENTAGTIDRHADLTPRMSTLVIINHVKEGLDLAARHKLRKPLRDVIASHHGTSLVAFFHNRAKQEETKDNPVQDEDYRYPGPLPRSKEAAIISLADSCEAASRSLEKPTPQRIDTLVSEIFSNRILDGQLKQADLTMQEINIVELTIKKNLTTMLHGRVAYPKPEVNESSFIETPKKASSEEPSAAGESDTADNPPKQTGPKIESEK